MSMSSPAATGYTTYIGSAISTVPHRSTAPVNRSSATHTTPLLHVLSRQCCENIHCTELYQSRGGGVKRSAQRVKESKKSGREQR
jgi:hypothetical protein